MKRSETQCSEKKFENNMVIKTIVPFRCEEIRCNAMKRSETPWGAMKRSIFQTKNNVVIKITETPRDSDSRELKHTRFWDADGNRKWAVFTFKLP